MKKEESKRRPHQSNRNRMIPLSPHSRKQLYFYRSPRIKGRRYAAYCTNVIVHPSSHNSRKAHTIFAPAPIAARQLSPGRSSNRGLPVVTTLRSLDHEALVSILTEPKNALIKQYAKFFEFDGVELKFTDDALQAIAEEAIKRSTGARALRTIIEQVMQDIMYEIPSQRDIQKVVITADTVRQRISPLLVTTPELRAAS